MDQDSIWKANIIHAMGNVLLERKRYLDAIHCYERSAPIKRRILDESHKEVLNSRYKNMGIAEEARRCRHTGLMVGSICAKMEIYCVALEHLKSLLELSRCICGANHRSVGNLLGRMNRSFPTCLAPSQSVDCIQCCRDRFKSRGSDCHEDASKSRQSDAAAA